MSDIRNVLFMEKFPPSSTLQCRRHMHSNHSLSVTLTHIHGSFLCLWYVRTADLHRQTKPVFVFFFFFFYFVKMDWRFWSVYLYFRILFFCHFLSQISKVCVLLLWVGACACARVGWGATAEQSIIMIFHRHLKLIWEAGRIWKWKGINEE